MSRVEWCVVSGLVSVGLLSPLVIEVYDAGAVAGIGLSFLGMVISFATLRFALAWATVQRHLLSPATAWGLLAWSVIPFAHGAYLGWLFVPFEVVFGAVLAAFRGNIPVKRALLPVLVARITALAVPMYVRSLM